MEETIQKSKLKYKDKNLEKIAKEKQLSNLSDYIKKWIEINNLLKKIDKLRKGLNYLYTDAINETLYSIQEDILNNDFELFYKTWIEGYEDGYNIHPEIYDKYKDEIEEKIKIIKSVGKYNL